MLLTCQNIQKMYDNRVILDSVSFTLDRGEKAALVGLNGCGKSTLLSIIMNQLESDGGLVKCFGTIGYLPQHFRLDENEGIYAFYQQDFEDQTVQEIISRIGLKGREDDRIGTLSGGQKTKLYLMKQIYKKPDLLILDEPTNHLDLEVIKWLEEVLEDFKGAILMVSHDRMMIDKIVHKIFEIESGNLTQFKGNYSDYRASKQMAFDQQMAAHHKYVVKQKQLEKAVENTIKLSNKFNNMSQNDFYRGKAAIIARRAKGIQKRMERLEVVEAPETAKQVNLKVETKHHKGAKFLMRGKNLTKAYDKPIFNGTQFTVKRGRKILLIGENGIGKSTLLKMMQGVIDYDGEISVNPNCQTAYFNQELEALDLNQRVYDYFFDVCDNPVIVRSELNQLMFSADQIYQVIGTLSEGEKVKLTLGRMLFGGVDLLILDEPTNHLDINTREVFEKALKNYTGTLIMVTHDRHLMQTIGNELWTIKDHQLVQVVDTYKGYMARQNVSTAGEDDKLLLEMKLAAIIGELSVISVHSERYDALEADYYEIQRILKA